MEPKKNPDKDIHRYSRHFFLIGLCISIAVIITAFEWRTEKRIRIKKPAPVESGFVPYPVPITVPENIPAPEPVKKVKLDPNKITEAKNIVEPADPEYTVEAPTVDFPVVQGEIDLPIESPIDTFMIVEHMPTPIGGYAGFYKQVATAIKYPGRARRMNTQGKVIVEFVINQQGDPINLKVIQGIGNGCDEEAMRVLHQAKWEPGKQRGKPVFVKMTLPIYFRLR